MAIECLKSGEEQFDCTCTEEDVVTLCGMRHGSLHISWPVSRRGFARQDPPAFVSRVFVFRRPDIVTRALRARARSSAEA